MKNQPLVSVLMTAYNREAFIAEAIESILASTYTNFELIIVDDASTDRTVEIAKGYEQGDKRIKVYVNEKNLGQFQNRNYAASLANGMYLKYVDSDDKVLEDGIRQCIDAMVQFPDASFGMNYTRSIKVPVELTPQEALNKHFFEKPFLIMGPGGTIIQKEYFESIDGYPTNYGPASDMYFNLKAACNTNIVLLPFKFLDYRRHPGQEINQTYKYLYGNYRYYDDAWKQLDLPLTKRQIKWLSKKNKRRFVVNILKYFRKTRNIKKTRNAIKLARFTFKDALIGVFHFD